MQLCDYNNLGVAKTSRGLFAVLFFFTLCFSARSYAEGSAAAVGAIVAPLAAAAAQVGTAAAQASADKHIAAETARASITNTKTKAATTLALSQNQLAINSMNLATTQAIFNAQTEASLERTKMQLDAVARAQDLQREMRREDRLMEQRAFDQQLALVREQMQMQFQLAKLSTNAKILQQSLNTGATPTTNSLSITSLNSTAASSGSSLLGARTASVATPLSRTAFSRQGRPFAYGVASGSSRTKKRRLSDLTHFQKIARAGIAPKRPLDPRPATRSLVSRPAVRATGSRAVASHAQRAFRRR